jgi:hypothetical protein
MSAAGDLLIRGGRVFDLDGDVDQPAVADVLIRGGRIVEIGTDIAVDGATPMIDATGHLVIPGLVNAHYHSHDVLLRGLFEQMPLDVWGFYSGPGNYPAAGPADVRLRTLLGAASRSTRRWRATRTQGSGCRSGFRSRTGWRPRRCPTGTRSAERSARGCASRWRWGRSRH